MRLQLLACFAIVPSCIVVFRKKYSELQFNYCMHSMYVATIACIACCDTWAAKATSACMLAFTWAWIGAWGECSFRNLSGTAANQKLKLKHHLHWNPIAIMRLCWSWCMLCWSWSIYVWAGVLKLVVSYRFKHAFVAYSSTSINTYIVFQQFCKLAKPKSQASILISWAIRQQGAYEISNVPCCQTFRRAHMHLKQRFVEIVETSFQLLNPNRCRTIYADTESGVCHSCSLSWNFKAPTARLPSYTAHSVHMTVSYIKLKPQIWGLDGGLRFSLPNGITLSPEMSGWAAILLALQVAAQALSYGAFVYVVAWTLPYAWLDKVLFPKNLL